MGAWIFDLRCRHLTCAARRDPASYPEPTVPRVVMSAGPRQDRRLVIGIGTCVVCGRSADPHWISLRGPPSEALRGDGYGSLDSG